MKRSNIPYPKVFNLIARQLAEVRTRLSKSVYKMGSEKYRGESENNISLLGILAELIAMHGLSIRGIPARHTPLIDVEPIVKPDIILQGGKTIDVKGLKGDVFRVNAKAHENMEKRPDFYWFIEPNSNYEAKSYLFSSSSVDMWQRVESTFTPVYQYEKGKL